MKRENSSSVKIPGKVLLSGEHAVVHGYPALVASIDKGITAEISKGSGRRDLVGEVDTSGLIKKAMQVMKVNPETVDVHIRSTIPVGSGLGSSAALAAGVIKAASNYLKRNLTDDEWYGLTMECERVAHENPSGADPAAVIYKGLLIFMKGKGFARMQLPKPIAFLLLQSGRPVEPTKDMVSLVGDLLKGDPRRTEALFKKIWSVTEGMQVSLMTGKNLKDLINENGVLLEELGVVGDKARGLSDDLRKLGYGVKVAGAGGVKEGSGMLLVYGDDYENLVVKLAEWGYDSHLISVGGVMNQIAASAPGKLMLFGEHAVVYGYPCTVTALLEPKPN